MEVLKFIQQEENNKNSWVKKLSGHSHEVSSDRIEHFPIYVLQLLQKEKSRLIK